MSKIDYKVQQCWIFPNIYIERKFFQNYGNIAKILKIHDQIAVIGNLF